MKYISATLTIILALLLYSVYGLTDTAQLFVDYMQDRVVMLFQGR